MKVDPASKNVSSYSGNRPDLVAHIDHAHTVLDLGCNEGAVSAQIKQKFSDAHVVGCDINPQAIRKAEKVQDESYVINLNDIDQVRSLLEERHFDVIVAGDVLEHLINPWKLLELMNSVLEEQGQMIISIPNIGRYELLWHLCRQCWPMRERGVHDNTHLRFFMYNNLNSLKPSKAECKIAERKFRLFEWKSSRLDRLVTFTFGLVPWIREFFVFQYILVIEKRK